MRENVPPGLPPAPPADPREFRDPALEWGYWTVVLPCVLMFCWTFVAAFGGLVANVMNSEGGPGSGLPPALDAYENGQLIAILAVIALLITGAAVRSRQRRSIALTAWGMFLLDIGCLFLVRLGG